MSAGPNVPPLTEEEIRRGFGYSELHRLLGGQRLLNCSLQQFVEACIQAERSYDALQDADQHIKDDMVVSAEVFLGRQPIFTWQHVVDERNRRMQK